MISAPPAVQDLIDSGALFAVNSSGGKDSQATLITVARLVPPTQLLVVHADLGEVEWHGALDHAQAQAEAAGAPFIVSRARKTFFDLVEHRHRTYPAASAFPTSAARQCTSDLKRDAIVRDTRRYADQHHFTQIVTCMGMRAQESPRRAQQAVFKRSARYSTARRDWFEWLPIHALSTDEVFSVIHAAGQQPHPAYARGNERLSCVFCIFGSRNDLRTGAAARPELFERYVELERRTGSTLSQSRRPLEEVTGLSVAEAYALHARSLT